MSTERRPPPADPVAPDRDGAGPVHLVLPASLGDPGQPSGGNVYGRRLGGELVTLGWPVRVHLATGDWPEPEPAARTGLYAYLDTLPDRALLLVDGLIAGAVPELLVPAAGRLRLVVLVHLPLGYPAHPGHRPDGARRAELPVLRAAAAVVTTSEWTRDFLRREYRLAPARVRVARPGVDRASPVPGEPAGGRLLCVAALTPHKGQDVLLCALTRLADRPWTLRCVGSPDRDPGYAARLRRRCRAGGLAGRVRFPGVLTGSRLARAYASTDLLVVPSYTETYGMVVSEALARAVPVLASRVGGVPEALGTGAGGVRPGLLVPPGDPTALATALRAWLTDDAVRQRLRRAAAHRRGTLTGWPDTARQVAAALTEVCQ